MFVAEAFWSEGLKSALFSGGIIFSLLFLLLIGFWTKFVEPMIRKTVEAWYNDPARTESREKFVKNVILNQVKLEDGSIALHTKKHVSDSETSLSAAVEALRTSLNEDRVFRHDMAERLGRLEGMIAIIAKQLRVPSPRQEPSPSDSLTDMAPVRPPLPKR